MQIMRNTKLKEIKIGDTSAVSDSVGVYLIRCMHTCHFVPCIGMVECVLYNTIGFWGINAD